MDERYYSLAEAARRHFPDGTIKKSGLYSEIQKGRLKAVKIAGKLLVTDADIAAMIEAARQDAADAQRKRASGAHSNPNSHPVKLSEERARLAQAAALKTARELTKGPGATVVGLRRKRR